MSVTGQASSLQPRPVTDAAIGFTSGVIGGIVNVYMGQPLDTVKVKMQTYPSLYRGALHCFRKTLASEGIRGGLYRGTVPNIIANIAENSVLFLSYGLFQRLVVRVRGKENLDALRPVENAIAGSCASVFSATALCPAELIKCRMQTTREKLKLAHAAYNYNVTQGPLQLAKQIIREEGFRGLFRGLTTTIPRDSVGYFFFFGSYELSRTLFLVPGQRKDDLGALPTFLSGGIGGVSLWLAVYPMDLVKSRVQVLTTDSNFLVACCRILKEEGFAALYAGLAPTLVRTFICSGCLFLTTKGVRTKLSHLVYGTSQQPQQQQQQEDAVPASGSSSV